MGHFPNAAAFAFISKVGGEYRAGIGQGGIWGKLEEIGRKGKVVLEAFASSGKWNYPEPCFVLFVVIAKDEN